MTHRSTRPTTLQVAAVAPTLFALTGLLALAGPLTRPAHAQPSRAADPAERLIIDGSVDDWQARTMFLGDEHHLYIRIKPGGLRSLTSGDENVILLIDADANPTTGLFVSGDARTPRLGVDLKIEFNRPQPDVDFPAPIVTAYDEQLRETILTAEQTGLLHMPTSASDWFEIRLDRVPLRGVFALPEAGVRSSGAAFALYTVQDPATNTELRRSTVFETRLPDAAAEPRRSTMPLPATPEGGLRIVAHNVLWASPETNPHQFSRVYKALNADIYLLQEWAVRGPERTGTTDPAAIAAWFSQWVDSSTEWHVETSNGLGVAIVSRFPIIAEGPDITRAQDESTWAHPVRLAAAVIESPLGPVVAASLHLKCCGTYQSAEDRRRLSEALAINNAVAELNASFENEIVIVGGDFNLVGSFDPMTTCIVSLDSDGSPLRVADAVVFGDRATYSWGGPQRGGRRSHLDFITYSDRIMNQVRAFILDTSILDDATLSNAGLQRSDTLISDHYPVVLDIKPY